jgi:LAS superfamily LD-carboxypeptidase LdcB
MTFKEFIAEARFDVSGATARQPRLPQKQATQQQTYPLQTNAPMRAVPTQQAAPQRVAPAVTQQNVATTSVPTQITAPTQPQQTAAANKNGQLTQQELKPVGKYDAGPSGARQWYGNTAYLSPKAADAFLMAQRTFGEQIPINSAYRNLEHQGGLSREGHKVVGKSGKSKHGLGNAVDIQPGTAAYNWFQKNGPKFGWHFAAIAGDPYHFEYRG